MLKAIDIKLHRQLHQKTFKQYSLKNGFITFDGKKHKIPSNLRRNFRQTKTFIYI